jgi:hypothetical protein
MAAGLENCGAVSRRGAFHYESSSAVIRLDSAALCCWTSAEPEWLQRKQYDNDYGAAASFEDPARGDYLSGEPHSRQLVSGIVYSANREQQRVQHQPERFPV